MIKNEKLLQLLSESKLIELALALEENIKEDNCTSKTGIKELNFIKSYLKNCKKSQVRTELHTILKNDEIQFICDGYSLVTLENQYNDAVEATYIVENLIPKMDQLNEVFLDIRFLLPELKIAIAKKEEVFQIGSCFLNAKKLYSILQLMPKTKIYTTDNGKNSVIVVIDGVRKAMMLPVIKHDDDYLR